MAPLGSIDFCKFTDSATSRRYCPETVCMAGEAGCACEDNVCPAVEKILGLLSIEALYVLLILLLLVSTLIVSFCCYLVCCRPIPQHVLVVPGTYTMGQPVATPEHPYTRMG